MKKLLALIAFGLPFILNAQKSDVTPLFVDKTPLDIKLKVSFKDIKKKTNDSTYLPSVLQYKNAGGHMGFTQDRCSRTRNLPERKLLLYAAPVKG
ncbi:MAG TPA: hypothetical protein PLR06_01095 [Cyclobacteriaceae bacterium]|nr:hypothetical protein [Cyclobacteriaceae bacterium]